MIDKNDPKLTAYAMGELSADEAREVEQSIANSPELATAVDEIRAMIGSLESAFADEPPLELALSDQQRLAIESAAQAGSKETDEEVASVTRAAKDTAATSARPWGRWLLAAAIGTVLIGGGVFLANSNVQRVRHAVVNETFSSKPAGAKTAMDSAQVAGDLLGRDLDDDSMPEEEFEPMLDLVQSTVDLGGVSGNMAGESAPLPAEETDVELALEENELRLAKALEISRNRARSSAHEMAMREDRFSRSKELMGEGNEPMSQPFYDFSLSGEAAIGADLLPEPLLACRCIPSACPPGWPPPIPPPPRPLTSTQMPSACSLLGLAPRRKEKNHRTVGSSVRCPHPSIPLID